MYLPKTCTIISITQTQVTSCWVLGPSGLVTASIQQQFNGSYIIMTANINVCYRLPLGGGSAQIVSEVLDHRIDVSESQRGILQR